MLEQTEINSTILFPNVDINTGWARKIGTNLLINILCTPIASRFSKIV